MPRRGRPFIGSRRRARSPGARAGADRRALLLRLVRQGRGVDAVAEPGRRRAVIEDVAEVPAAARALQLDALHAERVVLELDHVALRVGRPEARPAGAGLELLVGAEQLQA